MYHVAGTSLIAIILYLFSYFLYRTGFYTIQIHRKLWNSILAITFLATALAGILLALQINYKWNIPLTGFLLKWHVETGVAMAVTGLFHLLWHASYYLRLFESQDTPSTENKFYDSYTACIKVNLFIVGFLSSAFQLLLIREMMNIAGGYELITGTFLASWLITSAIGSVIAGKSNLYDLKRINLIFSLSPLVSIFLFLLLFRLFLNTGETPTFLGSMIYTFLVLIPFCTISGFTFIKLISAARLSRDYTPGKSFSIETIGGIVSGIVIAMLSSGILNTYQMLLILIISGVSYALLTYYISSPVTGAAFRISVSLLLATLIIANPDILFRSLLLPGIKVNKSEDTPYGNIVRGEYGGEPSIYYNQRLVSYQANTVEKEENIHYAVLQSRNPDKLLLISGSLQTHLPEILKYPVKEVVYVERDPALTRLEVIPLHEGKASLVVETDDAFRYVRNTPKMFDVIILLLPPPSSLLLNKYYTAEFFRSVMDRLNPGGVFMCSPGISASYYNDESVRLFSSVYNTLSVVFRNVMPVEGHKLYFIASDSELSASFCLLVDERKIDNTYVSADFLSDDLVKAKSEEIIALMDRNVPWNRAMFPVACFYYQSFNLSRNIQQKTPSIIIILIAFVLPMFLIRRRNIIMYSCASALAGFEIIVLVVLQITAGNMYQLTGLIIAGLMTGLAIGAGLSIRLLNSLSVMVKSLILASSYLMSGLLVAGITEIKSLHIVTMLLMLSAFIPSLLTGHLFRIFTLQSGSEADSVTSAVYTADLAGSALGFILISGLIVPALGIRAGMFTISAMVITGFIAGGAGRKH
jgi:spermidine synthase